jgi:hypothetical protein
MPCMAAGTGGKGVMDWLPDRLMCVMKGNGKATVIAF